MSVYNSKILSELTVRFLFIFLSYLYSTIINTNDLFTEYVTVNEVTWYYVE